MATLVPESDSSASPAPQPAAAFRDESVRVAALVLVAVAVLVRSALLVGRDYYADDFRLLHLADESTLLSPSYLGQSIDGHLMPGALLLAGVVERGAPLHWWLAAVTLIILQLCASLALLRLLRVLLGDRPLLLVPLAFGVFSPISLGQLGWWSAGLNSLPLQIGLAWVITEAVLLARDGGSRHAVRGTVGVAVTLAFYEKAVLVPALALAVVALVLLRDGERSWLAEAWRRGRALWLGSLAVLAVWAVCYVLASGDRSPVRAEDSAQVLETVYTGLGALAVGVLGGPFEWGSIPPSTPIADSPGWLEVVSGLVLLAACVWTCRRLRGAGLVWALVVGTTVVGLFIAAVGRAVMGLGETLPLAYRYFGVEVVLLPVAGALLATLPPRGSRAAPRPSVPALPGPTGEEAEQVGTPPMPGTRAVRLTTAATVLFILVALASTLDNARAWKADPSGDYLATARDALATASPAPLLDQAMPPDVVWGLARPWNNVSQALSPLEDRPPFADSTTELRAFDASGRLRPADVLPLATLGGAGQAPGCGWQIEPGRGTVIGLDNPLIAWEFTARLIYSAERAGTITVTLGSGNAVPVEVRAGENWVYVRLVGGGQELRVTQETPGLTCLRSGVVGGIAFL